jgi:hypothetical protein
MTAIAATGRRLTTKSGDALGPHKLDVAVTATKHVKAGGMVCLVSAGTCEPGKLGTGLVCLGVAQRDYDNTDSLSPAPVAHIETGNFSFFQTGTTITKAHIGTTVYMADDQTVTLSDAGASPAGTCVGIDDDGTSVIVAISPLLPITSHGFAVQSRSLSLAAAQYAAGQGSGADSNGTARRYNLGAALPAGAYVTGHLIRIVTPNTVNTTLSAAVGVITPTDDFDTIVTAQDLQAAAGYYAGTLGDAPDSSTLNGQAFYKGGQLTVTVTPDVGSKVSAADGEVHVTVWFLDGTGI